MFTKLLPVLLIGFVLGAVIATGVTLTVKPHKTVKITKTKTVVKKLHDGETPGELTALLGTPSGATKATKVTLPKNCLVYNGSKQSGAPTSFVIACGSWFSG